MGAGGAHHLSCDGRRGDPFRYKAIEASGIYKSLSPNSCVCGRQEELPLGLWWAVALPISMLLLPG